MGRGRQGGGGEDRLRSPTDACGFIVYLLLVLAGRACLVVFRGERAQYFKLSRKFFLGHHRRRLRHCGAKCLRQQRSDKLEIIVRLLLAQLPDPARTMTREIGLERAHEVFPHGAVATSAIERAVAVGAIGTSGHGLAPWCCGGIDDASPAIKWAATSVA